MLVNAQAERLFGYGRDDLLGEPVERLVPRRFQGRHVGHRDVADLLEALEQLLTPSS